MSPGEFNQKWSELIKRLLGDEAPIIKLGALCGFLTISHNTFEPPDQWGQKAKLIFVDAPPRTVQSFFTTHQLLNFPPNQLAELSGILDDAAKLEPSARDFQEKVIVARVLQLLFVGKLTDAAKLLDIVPHEVRATTNVDRAFGFIVAMQSHSLASHILPFIEQWKHDSRQGQFKSTEVRVLLYAPEHSGWPGHGVLSQLCYHSSLPVSRENLLNIPASSLVAVKAWLKRKGTLLATLSADLSCEDVRGDVSGQSHSLAAAALVAASVEESTSTWERVGFSPLLAITGEIDDEGWVRPVENLEAKITRAFYSPLSVVSVPSQQRREAELVVDRLKATAPTRELNILPIWNLSDILDPPVVGLRRKLDPVKWITYRSSTVSKVILAIASVLFLVGGFRICVIAYPKLDPWFDWQPVYWDVRDGKHVLLLNKAGQEASTVLLPMPWLPGKEADPAYSNRASEAKYRVSVEQGELEASTLDFEPMRMCQLADADADGQPEIFVRTHLDSQLDTVWQRTVIYCLAQTRDTWWFERKYEIRWQRQYDSLDFAPLLHRPALYPVQARHMVPVDWNGDGHSNVIIQAVDVKKTHNSSAVLIELDGRTGKELGRFFHTQWYFGLTAIREPIGGTSTFWAGTMSNTGWGPELFIFSDSLPNRVWPCSDIVGMRAIRYPLSDLSLALDAPTHVRRISQHPSRLGEVRLVIGSTTIYVDDGIRWRGYTFLVDPQARWLGDSFDLSYTTHLNTFEKRGLISLPDKMDEWLEPLTYAEQWTGSSWIPADTTRPKPDPYPVFERNDPRWNNIELPVRWQKL